MKKKFSKVLAVGLVLAMNLTGCSGAKTAENAMNEQAQEVQVVSLRVWGATEDQELLGQLVEGFKQEHSSEANLEIIVEAQDEGGCKTAILENVNEAPDVFTFADGQLMALAAAGVVEPITYAQEVATNNIEGAIEATTLNEKIYAYPVTADNGYFMYYNKAYFTDDDIKSLDKMLAVAEKSNKKIAMDWSSGWYLYSFFGNTGLELGLNEDYVTNYCTWNGTSGAIKGVDVVAAMQKIAASPAFVSISSDDFVKGVQDGSIIAGISGVWDAVAIEQAWQQNYSVAKLPTYTVAGKQIQMASYMGYKMVGVNSYSANKEWAEKLALYLTNEQSQTERFRQRGQGPSNINAANSEEVRQSLAIKAILDQSEFASIQRVGEMYWQPSTDLGRMLASGNLGGYTAQGLLDHTVKEITASIIEE